MDYRKPLFDLVCSKYQVKFFFQRRSDIDSDYDVVYGRKRIAGRLPSPRDIVDFYKGIKDCDLFTSSFLFEGYSMTGIILARMMRKKIVIWEELSHFFGGFRSAVKRWVSARLARHVDAFFVLGEPQRHALHKLGVPDARIFVANEYPGHVYAEIEAGKIESLGVASRDVILYLGRFVPFKGIDYLLEAYSLLEKKHSNTLLLIVGYGPLKEELERQAKDLCLKTVEFIGPITDINKKKYLFEISRMLVVPSVIQKGKGLEGGPLVVLEALSAGTPVLGTNGLISSTQFISNGVNGFIVPHSDAEALCEKMEEILNWPDHRAIREKVRAGFGRIRGFDYQFEMMQEAIRYCIPENAI